jgi:hypothetical protein
MVPSAGYNMNAAPFMHVAFVLVLLACTSGPEPGALCASATRMSCRCANGKRGYAVCEGSDRGYGACQCGAAITDGSEGPAPEASTGVGGANASGGAYGSGGSLASGGATDTGGTSSIGGVAGSGGGAGCGASGNCGAAPNAGGASATSPDGSDCGAPVDGWCPPGCIRLFGDKMDAFGENVISRTELAACARSCVDGTGTTPVKALLSDGVCWGLFRSCDDWSSRVMPCVYRPSNGTLVGGDQWLVSVGEDGGNPCALADIPPRPYQGAVLLPTIRSSYLHERASLDDCGSREGYYVDWTAGNPRIVLCPASCTLPDGGRPTIEVTFR